MMNFLRSKMLKKERDPYTSTIYYVFVPILYFYIPKKS